MIHDRPNKHTKTTCWLFVPKMGMQNGHLAQKNIFCFQSKPILKVHYRSCVEQFLSRKALFQLNNQPCNSFRTLLFHSFYRSSPCLLINHTSPLSFYISHVKHIFFTSKEENNIINMGYMLCTPIKHKESKLCMTRSRKKQKCGGENVFSRSQYIV